MAFVVETGSVVAGATSYVTTDEADAFFEDRADAGWAAITDDAQKEAALIKACEYMQAKYRMRWEGSRIDANQRLDWPRRGVPVPDFFDPFYRNRNVPPEFYDTYFVPTGTIPNEVKQAQMLLARQVMTAAGLATNSLQTPLGRVTKREKVGELEVEYMTSADGASVRQTNYYWDAEQLLQPYFRSQGNARVTRG